jgi:hypothetical protein
MAAIWVKLQGTDAALFSDSLSETAWGRTYVFSLFVKVGDAKSRSIRAAGPVSKAFFGRAALREPGARRAVRRPLDLALHEA